MNINSKYCKIINNLRSSFEILGFCPFSVSDVFAVAKVMLFAVLIMMLRAYARSDVMFAHCAEGTTSFTQ